ncbi:MAG: nitrilase-related carbon-nitrogen hydrolase, partial [Pseudomonadota bacterium]
MDKLDDGAAPGMAAQADRPAAAGRARVTVVQMAMRPRATAEVFYADMETYVRAAAAYESDFVVFPELFTLQLLTAEPARLTPEAAIERLSEHTDAFVARLRTWAVEHRVNIIGGSHPTRIEGGAIRNIAYTALRDGTVHAQEKL